MNTKVVILQHRLLHYRVDFFQGLRAALARDDIDLVLVHGQASASESVRQDEGHLPWAVRVRNRFLRVAGRDLIWQPLPETARDADLCVMIQENRVLSNYPLILRRRLAGARGAPLAFWGHGRNFQSRAPRGWRERWKALMLRQVDWWFAYTAMTVEHLRASGFAADRISNLNNAIDVSAFQRQIETVSRADLARWRAQLGLAESSRIAVFCGSMYPEKRIDLLLASADLIRARLPDFHLLMIGEGPDAVRVREAAASRPWLHVLGVRTGTDKAALFRLARVQLNPGLVGLHVLDAFSAGLPMITTARARHSPEIAYLQGGRTGLVLEDDHPRRYAEAVSSLLSDEARLRAMRAACLDAACLYTLDGMVQHFRRGVLECLARHGRLPAAVRRPDPCVADTEPAVLADQNRLSRR